MLGLIITVVIFVIIIILVYFYLGKLSGAQDLTKENSDMTNNSNRNLNLNNDNGETSNQNRINSNSINRNAPPREGSVLNSRNSGVANMGNMGNTINMANPINMGNISTTLVAAETAEPKALTKKDQRKMEKKKVKEENREYQKMLLEEKKMREEAREKEYREKEMKREEERRQEEELLKKLKEEREKKENDIYNQWKDKFEIHEEGEEVGDFSSENVINDFLNYIKIRKVVSLEDLSGVYKIHPNDLVDRLTFLEAQGRITGIVDDRGKYIYLTEKELAAIEKVFMQRGRISKAELIKECNKVIRFEPSEEDKLKILEEQKMEWRKLEEQINNK